MKSDSKPTDSIKRTLPFIDDRFGKSNEMKVTFARYEDGGIAISIVDTDGSPYAKATINVGSDEDRALMLEDNLVAIKNYSENEGIEPLLIKNGIILDGLMGQLDTGNLSVNVYRLSQLSLDCIHEKPEKKSAPKMKF